MIRAVGLLALGYALTALDTEVDVIFSFYGLLFLIVLPLYRLRAAALALIAAAGALVLPQVLYAVRKSIEEGAWADTVVQADPLARIGGTDGVVELLCTGAYPVLTWAPFLIAGMAVARLDLTRPRIRSRLALTGGALAVLGYGGSGWPCASCRTRSSPSRRPRAAVRRRRPGGPTRSANPRTAHRSPGSWWPHRTARPLSPFSATQESPSW